MTFADLRRLNRACTFSSGHKAVLFSLSTYMDGQGRARPGLETLVADCGLTTNRVRAIVRDLVEAGFIVVTKEKVGTVYTLQKLPEKTEGCTQPSEGCTQPSEGCTQPSEGCTQPPEGCTQPSEGCTQPFSLYKGKTQEEPKKRDSAGAGVETFSDEVPEGRRDLVAYRGSEQPLARLAWAERTAKFHIEALGLSEADAAKLRGEWQAFLVGRAERARANQANMLQVDQAAARLREIVQGGGVACAVEAVGFAVASGAVWPVPKPSRSGVSGAKVSSFGGDLMRSYEGTAKTTASAEQLKGFGI